MALPSLKDLCTPRKSVFDKARHDVVLDLSDLIAGKIKAADFFEENFAGAIVEELKSNFYVRLPRESSKSDAKCLYFKRHLGRYCIGNRIA